MQLCCKAYLAPQHVICSPEAPLAIRDRVRDTASSPPFCSGMAPTVPRPFLATAGPASVAWHVCSPWAASQKGACHICSFEVSVQLIMEVGILITFLWFKKRTISLYLCYSGTQSIPVPQQSCESKGESLSFSIHSQLPPSLNRPEHVSCSS